MMFESFERRVLLSGNGGAISQPNLIASPQADHVDKNAVELNLSVQSQVSLYNAQLTAAIATKTPASGKIQFYSSAKLLGEVRINDDQRAVLNVVLQPGEHTISAHFSGDDAHAPADSQAITYTAGKLFVGMDNARRADDGSVVVDWSHFPVKPTGTVYFGQGPTPAESSTLAAVKLVDGVAVLRQVPDHYPNYLSYAYSGDTYYQGQMYRIDIIPMPIVDHKPVNITITPPAGAVVAGKPANFQIQVVDPDLQAGQWYAGAVKITLDGQDVDRVDVDETGRAEINLTMTAGRHEITAVFDRGLEHARVTDPFHASGAGASITAEVTASSVSLSVTPSSQVILPQGYSIAPAWQAITSTDFNGDGVADYLFGHAGSGRAYVWLMNGQSVATQTGLTPGNGWRVAGASDFDGDGKADILWTNDTTGKQAVWKMNGTAIRGFSVLNHTPARANWRLESVTDLNGDGKDDLLWRNVRTGTAYGWLLDGLRVIGGGAL